MSTVADPAPITSGASRRVRALVPGLAVVVAITAGAFALKLLVPAITPQLWGVVLGVATIPYVRDARACEPGLAFAGRRILRAGVAMLGLTITLAAFDRVGARGVLIGVATLVLTIGATLLAGRRLGVSPQRSLLIGAGTGICGASAVAAVGSATRAERSDIAYALATVTMFGSAAMVALPALILGPVQLSDAGAGIWIGASVHEVGQVAGAGAAVSDTVLQTATIEKLVRVLMLAPTVAAIGLWQGRSTGGGGRVPAFILAFAGFVVLRTVVPLPGAAVDAARLASAAMLTAGLAALATRMSLRELRAAGTRPLLLGLVASIVAASASFGLITLTG
jgi:uncharacterized integral membrane protein (TIGR00698 family)